MSEALKRLYLLILKYHITSEHLQYVKEIYLKNPNDPDTINLFDQMTVYEIRGL